MLDGSRVRLVLNLLHAIFFTAVCSLEKNECCLLSGHGTIGIHEGVLAFIRGLVMVLGLRSKSWHQALQVGANRLHITATLAIQLFLVKMPNSLR